MNRISVLKTFLTFSVLWFLVGCSFLIKSPDQTDQEKRFQAFDFQNLPIDEPVRVYWDKYSIPFIEAETDQDAAFTLGLVHAHLRLGQMEILKRISQGRMSELVGPLAVDIDHTIRIINNKKSLKLRQQAMPKETKVWLESYVKGINFFISKSKQLPFEFDYFDLERQKWTSEDVLFMGRFIGIDLSWPLYLSFLNKKKENPEDWQKLWKLVGVIGNQSPVSFRDQNSSSYLSSLFEHFSKSGSNSLVIGPKKSKSATAMIANDPHLGIFAPNVWLIVGLKSPSYHLVGLTVPGVPLWGLGRNKHLAWGGTNMRGISSHLIQLNEEDLKDLETVEEEIKVKWWFDSTKKIRFSSLGPVITDSALFENDTPLALQWTGYQISDELTSFLKANRASSAEEFLAAFENFAVGAQNMLYATSSGDVGQIMAYRQPILQQPEKTLDLIKERHNTVVEYKNPLQLPSIKNPRSNYIASANNQPVRSQIPIAFSFPPEDRHKRMVELVEAKEILDLTDLRSIQLDTVSPSARDLARLVSEKSARLVSNSDLLKTLKAWEGDYRSEKKGPVAFQVLMYHLAPRLLELRYKNEYIVEYLTSRGYWKKQCLEIINTLDTSKFESLLLSALEESESRFAEIENWGEMHKQRIQHPLGNLPVVGARFQFQEFPAEGGNDTLNKSGHRFSDEPGYVTYGANSRHISILNDPDENYFVLLGGQDGWLKSPSLLNQVSLWRQGKMVRVPLQVETLTKTSVRVNQFKPLNRQVSSEN